jgi:hypothetical protein
VRHPVTTRPEALDEMAGQGVSHLVELSIGISIPAYFDGHPLGIRHGKLSDPLGWQPLAPRVDTRRRIHIRVYRR